MLEQKHEETWPCWPCWTKSILMATIQGPCLLDLNVLPQYVTPFKNLQSALVLLSPCLPPLPCLRHKGTMMLFGRSYCRNLCEQNIEQKQMQAARHVMSVDLMQVVEHSSQSQLLMDSPMNSPLYFFCTNALANESAADLTDFTCAAHVGSTIKPGPNLQGVS